MMLVGGDLAIVERRSFPGELSRASILEAWSGDVLMLGWGGWAAAVQQQSGSLRSLVFRSLAQHAQRAGVRHHQTKNC